MNIFLVPVIVIVFFIVFGLSFARSIQRPNMTREFFSGIHAILFFLILVGVIPFLDFESLSTMKSYFLFFVVPITVFVYIGYRYKFPHWKRMIDEEKQD